MLIRRRHDSAVLPSEITSERVWRDRRRLLAQLGASAAALALGRAAPAWALADDSLAIGKKIDLAGGEKINRFADITHYNNFYEFGAYKSDPADNAHTLRTRPWTVEVGGECEAPARLGIEDILKIYPLEERIYRHRCVEGWSMVVPWDGFALAPLLRRFKPTAQAKFVAFQTLYDPAQMPQAGQLLPWPYREALRIDEAMHPLAFLSLGMYGQALPAQDGAPLRLTLPWKYGFKSIKSIVRIGFVERAPDTTWNMAAPEEYGFYANVNPNVDHPRWSQASERRLGEFFKRPTLMFNGYPEVAPLYAGLDLHKFY